MSYSSQSINPPNLSKERVLELCKVPPHKLRGICLYGSQVYGNQNRHSDYDFLVIACTMNAHKEFNDGYYNVHIKTPDRFYDELIDHKMSALECLYAPKFARIHDLKLQGLENFSITPAKLQRKSLSESHNSWNKARMMINDGDMYRGMKSIWHSLRILLFADQILNEGYIFDFSEANNYWEEINESNAVKWNEFKKLLINKKRTLEDIVRSNK